jgi:hypothetical protein
MAKPKAMKAKWELKPFTAKEKTPWKAAAWLSFPLTFVAFVTQRQQKGHTDVHVGHMNLFSSSVSFSFDCWDVCQGGHKCPKGAEGQKTRPPRTLHAWRNREASL